MTTICKAMLSGGTPRQIRDRTQGLVPARLRDLAIQLAGHPDLTDLQPRHQLADVTCYGTCFASLP